MKKVHEIFFPALIERVEEVTVEGTALRMIKVGGVAIKEVVSRNGYKYVAKELEKATSSLVGKPLLKDHKNSVDNIVGKVTSAMYDANDKSIKFEGTVFDEHCKELIKGKFINHVSIGASITGFKDEESASGEKYKAVEGLEILELSLTPVPGVPMASVSAESQAVILAEAYGKYEEEDNQVLKEKVKEEVKMAEEKKVDESIAVKEGFAELINALDSGWSKETLMKFEISALKELLAKVKSDVQKKTEMAKVEVKAEPKGTVAQEVAPASKGPMVVTIPAGTRVTQMEAGTYVKEISGDGKASVWKVPDYKKYRAY